MDIREVLLTAADIISDESRWCVGARARNADGRLVEIESDEAVKFCAIGAVYKAAAGDIKLGRRALDAVQRYFISNFCTITLVEVNDAYGRESAIKVLRATAKQEGDYEEEQ